MLVAVILAVAIGLGAFFALGNIGTGMGEAIYAFAVGMLKLFFIVFMVIWPVVVFVVPLYILSKRQYTYIILGGIYGLAIVLVVYLFNLPALAMQLFYNTFQASFIGIPIIGSIAEYIVTLAYWLYGITLSIFDGTLLSKIRSSWHKAHTKAKKAIGGKKK
mgnify:CR=1 FL=1